MTDLYIYVSAGIAIAAVAGLGIGYLAYRKGPAIAAYITSLFQKETKVMTDLTQVGGSAFAKAGAAIEGAAADVADAVAPVVASAEASVAGAVATQVADAGIGALAEVSALLAQPLTIAITFEVANILNGLSAKDRAAVTAFVTARS